MIRTQVWKSSFVFVFLVLAGLASCSRKDHEVSQPLSSHSRSLAPESAFTEVSSQQDMVSTEASGVGAFSKVAEDSDQGGTSFQPQKKIVKSGNVSLAVPSIEALKEAEKYIRFQLAEVAGRFDQEHENRYGNQASITFVARISAEKFEDFVQKILTGPYTLVNRQIGSSEVTDRYIDLEVRLKNKKELRERYREILKKATKVADVIALNQSIEAATSEIESLEGQFRYLKNQVAESTLTIQLTANLPSPIGQETSFWQDLARAVQDGTQNLRGFVVGLVALWPFLLLAVIGGSALRWFWRWRRGRRES